MNAAQLFIKCLENEGVEYVFGIPGEENLEVMDALLDSGIRFITTRHEQGAAFMADVYGRLSGRAGVCLSTLGPGATNLVTGDTNAAQDVFVRDRVNNTTTRVSLPNLADQGSLGSEAENGSWPLTISASGRYVAFSSTATNLVIGDTNALQDIFVHDTQTGTTTRASVPNLSDQGSLGAQATSGFSSWPSISSDGRYVLFRSSAANLVIGDTNGRNDAFVHDMQTRATTRVSVPNLADQGFLGAEGDSSSATMNLSISSDGRYVAFASDSTNLVTGDTNAAQDIFVHDTQTGTTIRVNMDSAGTESDGDSHSAFISADGRYVAFISDATNLVAGDTNAVGDIFRVLNTTP